MKKAKKIALAVVAALVVLLVAVAAMLVMNMPKRVQAGVVDFAALADGVYTGSCENGLVAATVAVTVENHAVTRVEILQHQNGQGSGAEAVAQQVVEKQSLQIDAVAGATFSSDTILKAIENALASAYQAPQRENGEGK